MKSSREHLSGWPSWLPKTTPCVAAGKGQWKRARKLLASDDEGSETCAIVAGRGAVVGVVTLDGREAWVRGEHVQPRRPWPGGWTARVKSYKGQTAGAAVRVAVTSTISDSMPTTGVSISLPPLSTVPPGRKCTITRVGDRPVTIQPHHSDTGLPSPQGEVINLNASSTTVRVGGGWRKLRAKLRSWLVRFEDWGSV